MAGTDERKPVTVLFADLAGSTKVATRHDPEHLRALLSAFYLHADRRTGWMREADVTRRRVSRRGRSASGPRGSW